MIMRVIIAIGAAARVTTANPAARMLLLLLLVVIAAGIDVSVCFCLIGMCLVPHISGDHLSFSGLGKWREFPNF